MPMPAEVSDSSVAETEVTPPSPVVSPEPRSPAEAGMNAAAAGHDQRFRCRALACLAASLAILSATVFIAALLRNSELLSWIVVFAGLWAAVAGFAFGVLNAGAALWAMPRPRRAGAVLAMVLTLGVSLVFLAFGAIIALGMTFGFSRGRQLRRRGKVLLPPVGPGASFAGLALVPAAPQAVRAGLAAEWRENGRTEHASVAAFARLTLDLMALGAPASLVESANRDARDEIRHTELCFSLARGLDGAELGPGAFPRAGAARTLPRNRRLALAKLAVDSLVDGALHEGVSARVIAQLVRRSQDAVMTEVLREIAADEGRHAAHGWDAVRWCLAEGGRPVADALLGALWVLPERPRSALPAEAEAGSWERYGIHGRELELAEYADALADLKRRVRELAAAAPGLHAA